MKNSLPDLFVSSFSANNWTGKDIFELQKAIAKYEQDAIELERLQILERKINVAERLNERYAKSFDENFARVNWSWAVNWPESVLLYEYSYWSLEDLQIMEAKVDEVIFIPNSMKTVSPARSEFLKNRLMKFFGQDEWAAVREFFPFAHFTSPNPEEWTDIDFLLISKLFTDEQTTHLTKNVVILKYLDLNKIFNLQKLIGVMLEKAIKVLQELPPLSQTKLASVSPKSQSKFALSFKFKTCTKPLLLEAFQSALYRGLTAAALGPIHRFSSPTKLEKWTVLSSPFVHKTARTQFERRTAEKGLQMEGIETEECRERIIWWVKRIVPDDVELEIQVHERASFK